jgi:arabinogalactan oligomer / maltooligosaccharide transport system substrate-binding protein
MHTKKWYVLLILLLLGAMALVACGGGNATPEPQVEAPVVEEPVVEEPVVEEPVVEEPTEEPTVAPEPEATATTETAAAEDVLVIWADDTRSAILQSLGEEFEAEYGVAIQVEQKEFGGIRDDFKIAGPAGEGPDIIIGAHDWLGELVINGLLRPLDLGAKRDQFIDAAVQAFVYEGELYGMPYSMENVAFVYNPEILAEGGYDEPPSTWTEVMEIAADLEEQGLVEQGYIRQEGDPYHFFPIQTAFGGYVFGLTDEGYDPTDVGVDDEGSLAAAEWLGMMVDEGHILPAVDYDIMHESFESGNAAMMITGPWALPRIRESGVPYVVTSIPGEVQEAQPFLGVQGFMVSAFSENAVLAEAFLTEFVATDAVMQQIYETDPRPSAFIPVFEAIEDEDIAGFAEAGRNGLAMPAIPEMSAVWSAWTDAIVLVTQGGEEPEPAFTNAAQQIRTAIEESGGN